MLSSSAYLLQIQSTYLYKVQYQWIYLADGNFVLQKTMTFLICILMDVSHCALKVQLGEHAAEQSNVSSEE